MWSGDKRWATWTGTGHEMCQRLIKDETIMFAHLRRFLFNGQLLPKTLCLIEFSGGRTGARRYAASGHFFYILFAQCGGWNGVVNMHMVSEGR